MPTWLCNTLIVGASMAFPLVVIALWALIALVRSRKDRVRNVVVPTYNNGIEDEMAYDEMAYAVRLLAYRCHEANQTWWHHPATGKPLDRNVGEMLMLAVTELAEAMEGYRKDRMDDKLPHRKMIEVELADALIRIFDTGRGLDLDLPGAFVEKMRYNAVRADHKPENRVKPGGKKF